jgi:TonB family protein
MEVLFMRANQKYMVAIDLILLVAIMMGYFIAKTSIFENKRDLPVFIGEGIFVSDGAEALKGDLAVKKVIKVKRAAQINQAADISKSVDQPLPQPKVTTPLPIVPPKISYKVLPQYPASALHSGLEGTTILSIYIGASGKPEDIEVRSSSGASELDKSAVSAVSQWEFNPATQGGRAISSWFEVPVRFVINQL